MADLRGAEVERPARALLVVQDVDSAVAPPSKGRHGDVEIAIAVEIDGARIGDPPDPIEDCPEGEAAVSRVECHEHSPHEIFRGHGVAEIADHEVREPISIQVPARDARRMLGCADSVRTPRRSEEVNAAVCHVWSGEYQLGIGNETGVESLHRGDGGAALWSQIDQVFAEAQRAGSAARVAAGFNRPGLMLTCSCASQIGSRGDMPSAHGRVRRPVMAIQHTRTVNAVHSDIASTHFGCLRI